MATFALVFDSTSLVVMLLVLKKKIRVNTVAVNIIMSKETVVNILANEDFFTFIFVPFLF